MRNTTRQLLGLIALLALVISSALLINAASPKEEVVSEPGFQPDPAGPTLGTHAVRGVNYAHIHRGGRGYGSDASRAELQNLTGLGVDWIALNPFGYQQSSDQDHVAGYDPDAPLEDFTRPQLTEDQGPGRDRSMTNDHLAQQIRAAHELGVKVMIKPHIWSRDFWNGDNWHGTVDQTTPEAHERWRKSYLRFMLHHARIAEENNADALCLGTELICQTANHHDDWLTLIREVKKIYSGKLTYAAHWDQEFTNISFWGELDAIGISAYFPLDVTDDATIDQLVQAWQPHKQRIEAVHKRYDKPVVFLEVGYRPVTGAYREPWLHRGGEVDAMIQARAFEALFKAYAQEPWWHGVFVWKVFTDAQRGEGRRRGPGFSFRHQPAEHVIQQWFLKP